MPDCCLTYSDPRFAHCSQHSGVCQASSTNTNMTWALGNVASPTFANGALTIVYDHGDKTNSCPNPRKTIVTFQCDPVSRVILVIFSYLVSASALRLSACA